MLETAGLESVTCMQVDEVLEALRAESFDALLTDIQMPAISGLDLLRLLRASNLAQARDIPVIAVTARADTERETMIAQGFAGLLHKPFSLKDLAAELTMDIALPTAPPVHTQPAKLDFAALTAYSGDDAEAALDILRSFVDETHRAADRLRQAIEKDNASDAAAVAHKLIPLFILIGASPAVALLRRLIPQMAQPSQAAVMAEMYGAACLMVKNEELAESMFDFAARQYSGLGDRLRCMHRRALAFAAMGQPATARATMAHALELAKGSPWEGAMRACAEALDPKPQPKAPGASSAGKGQGSK